MDLGIEGRRAAVAAGSAGLGLALATHLTEAGAHVVVCGRDAARLDEGGMWPTSYALKALTPVEAARIEALVRRATTDTAP